MVDWYCQRKSDEHDDYLVSFMTPCGEAKQYCWPTKEDKCWIEITNLLCTIQAPIVSSSSLRGYSFPATDIQRIKDILKQKSRV